MRCLHLAGAIAAPERRQFFAINDDRHTTPCRAGAKAGVKRFVHMSSLAAREPQLSDYAASKRAAEDASQPSADHDELRDHRPPAVYGPGDKATLAAHPAIDAAATRSFPSAPRHASR